MRTFMLFTGSGPLVILTSHATIEAPGLLQKLEVKGLDKFLAYEIPLDLAQARYGMHFEIVARNLAETDDLRVLDFDGSHAMRLFRFDEMTGPMVHERRVAAAAA